MKVVFRADASLQIGTGHVMRCLTLADALAARGADCQFVCREHAGNLIEFIMSKGHVVHVLPTAMQLADLTKQTTDSDKPELAHGHWLGATQAQDVQACAPILAKFQPDWLIVDHYALDARWELAVKPHSRKLMVVNDLADRSHACDILLDQTFGRSAEDYRRWVPAECQLLCGSQFALLRPEFLALRAFSLQRREKPQLQQLLITMGGVDKDNVTSKVLESLTACALPDGCNITVVMGPTAPWLDEVKRQAKRMPWPTGVLVGVSNMARLMADSDFAIGAAGATTWERCCLGLPTAMMVVAENQKYAAKLLEQAGAVHTLDLNTDLADSLKNLVHSIRKSRNFLMRLIEGASNVADGKGAQRVADHLINEASK